MPLYESINQDVSRLFHPTRGADAVLVGCDRQNPSSGIWWRPNHGGHAISFGMTRSGKGLQIIGALCQYAGSTLTIDPVGANAWATAERRRQLGHRVVILDPFDEVNRRFASLVRQKETTTRFNPLSVIDPASPDFAEDVMMLAEAVIIPAGNDPHWTDSARALVAGLIAAIVENSPRGRGSFRQVRKLLTSSDAELAASIKILYERNPNSFAGRNLRRFASGTKEVASIRSTADTQTFPFESLRLLDSMETDADAFDFAELATRHISVFLVLPVDRLQTYGRWLRLIITLAIRAITRAPRPPRLPVLFILDELGTINPGGGLRMIEQAYGLMAGQGIRIWAFLQDLKQLQHDYPKSWETFISNSELVQLLKVNDNTTAEYFSNYIGQKEVFKETLGEKRDTIPHRRIVDGIFCIDPMYSTRISEEKWENTPGPGGGTNRKVSDEMWSNKYVVGHESIGFQAIMRPDQLIAMGATEDNICIFSGNQAYRMSKVNYYADPRFRGLCRPSPHFPQPGQPKPAPAAAAPPPQPKAPRPGVAPWSRPLSSGRAAPAPPARSAELPRPAAAKPSSSFAARRQVAADAKARAKAEAAAIKERARWAETLRNAK